MLGRREVYDLIFSMGAACSCAEALKKMNLRQFSSPFDWLFGSTFRERCQILSSDFLRFMEESDLEYSYSERSISCDAYFNKHNHLTFNHDFAANKELRDTFPEVKEKYNRRIGRLLDTIKISKKILIVYIETPDTEEHTADQDIVAGWNDLHRKYPDKQVDFLFFSNDNLLKPKKYKKENISKNITKVIANYKSTKSDALAFEVNYHALARVLSAYRLNISIFKKTKILLEKLFVSFVPCKSYRRRLRKYYHI